MSNKDRKTRVVVDFVLHGEDPPGSDEYPRLAFFCDSLDGVPTIGQYTIMPRITEAGYTPTRVRVTHRSLTPPIEDDDLLRYFATLTVEQALE